MFELQSLENTQTINRWFSSWDKASLTDSSSHFLPSFYFFFLWKKPLFPFLLYIGSNAFVNFHLKEKCTFCVADTSSHITAAWLGPNLDACWTSVRSSSVTNRSTKQEHGSNRSTEECIQYCTVLSKEKVQTNKENTVGFCAPNPARSDIFERGITWPFAETTSDAWYSVTISPRSTPPVETGTRMFAGVQAPDEVKGLGFQAAIERVSGFVCPLSRNVINYREVLYDVARERELVETIWVDGKISTNRWWLLFQHGVAWGISAISVMHISAEWTGL
jgi:hypothetical protein